MPGLLPTTSTAVPAMPAASAAPTAPVVAAVSAVPARTAQGGPTRPRRSRPAVMLAVLLVLLFVTPTASAAAFRVHEPLPTDAVLFIPGADEFHGADAAEGGAFGQLAFFAAETRVQGDSGGPIVFSGPGEGAHVDAGRIRVWDRSDPMSLARGEPAFESLNGSLLPAPDGTLYYGVHEFVVDGRTPFAFSTFVDVLGSLPDMGLADARGVAPYEPALVTRLADASGPDSTDPGTATEPTGVRDGDDPNAWRVISDPSKRTEPEEQRQWIIPIDLGGADGQTAFTVRDANGTTQTFTGDRWFATLRGPQVAMFVDGVLALPMSGNTTVSFSPGPDDAFDATFTNEAFGSFVSQMAAIQAAAAGLGTFDPEPSEEELRQAARDDPRAGEHVLGGDEEAARALQMAREWYARQQATLGEDAAKAMADAVRADPALLAMLYSRATAGDGSLVDAMDDQDQPGDNETDDGTNRSADGARGTGDGNGGDPGGPSPADAAGFDLAAFRGLGDFANGILFGDLNATFRVGDEVHAEPGLSIVRFSDLAVEGFVPGAAQMQGDLRLAFMDGRFQTGSEPRTMGPFQVPWASWVLYLLALGAYVAARFWQYRDPDHALSNRLQPSARIAHWLSIVFFSVLFDREISFLLGTSLIDMLLNGSFGADWRITGIVALLQLGFWAVAVAYFGVPLRIIANAGLKMGGLTKATRGYANAIAPAAGWLFGSAYVLPLLSDVMGNVLEKVGGGGGGADGGAGTAAFVVAHLQSPLVEAFHGLVLLPMRLGL